MSGVRRVAGSRRPFQLVVITLPGGNMSWYVSVIVRGVLVWLLAGSAIEKSRHPGNLEGLLRSRFGWREARARNMVRLVTAAEGVCAAALLLPHYWWIGAAGCTVLFGIFAVVVAHWVRSGITGDCGCGGLMPTHSVSSSHVFFALSLAALSVGIAAYGLLGDHTATTSGMLSTVDLLLLLVPLPVLVFLSILSEFRRVQAQLRSVPARYWGA